MYSLCQGDGQYTYIKRETGHVPRPHLGTVTGALMSITGIYDMTQTADTITRAYARAQGKPNELLYECRGYTNLQELKEKCDQWAKANGYESTWIEINPFHAPQTADR